MKPTIRSITNKFVVRTPCLSVSTVIADSNHAEVLRQRLRELVGNPAVRESLLIASQSIDAAIDDWLADPWAAKNRATERSILRYVTRMSTRATPFGLFSACTVGNFDEHTALELADRAKWQRRTRIDNDYLFDAVLALGQDRELRKTLTYWPNDTGYIAAGKLRYAEARTTGSGRAYFLMSAGLTDYLKAILERASSGATIADLSEVLCRDPEITPPEAEEFLHELIDAQVITSKLMPNVTGRESTLVVADLLETTDATGKSAAKALKSAFKRVEALDAAPMGAMPGAYSTIMDELGAEMPAAVRTPKNISRTFQVDLFSTLAQRQLSHKVLAELERAALFLGKIANIQQNSQNDFRKAFEEKFESQTIPLSLALDNEAGVRKSDGGSGTDSPVLAGIALPNRGGAPQAPAYSPKGAWIAGMFERAKLEGAKELVITDADVEACPKSSSDAVPFLGGTSAMIAIAAKSQADIDAGRFDMRVIGISGPSGVNLFGRFCYGSREIHDMVLAQIAAEEGLRPDAVFAEIVHLPQGRIGNILFRPVLRDYEITYLGISGAPDDRHIPLSDLMVTSKGGRVVLISKRLGKEVIPRLSTAHNYSMPSSFPLYKFLCSIQAQYFTQGGWSWEFLDGRPHLPRVRYGNIVLDRAQWRLTAKDLEGIEAATAGHKKVAGQEASLAAMQAAHVAVTELRNKLQWPRWVAIAESDNELVIDLDNPAMTEMMAHELRGARGVEIVEMYPAPDETWITGPGGTYVHEISLPLFRDPEPAANAAKNAGKGPAKAKAATATDAEPEALKAPAQPRALLPPEVPRDDRLLAVGSECLYVKLYCGQTVANAVLREVMVPLLADSGFRASFDDWFFLRYADPDPHLRLRFFGEPARLLAEVLPAITAAVQPLLANGTLDKIVLDTYQREVERYGGLTGVRLAEKLFSRDSDLAMTFLEHTDDDAIPEVLWPMAVVAIDKLLEDFGYSPEGKFKKMSEIADGFLSEFGMNPAYQKRLGDKFKLVRGDIAAAFTNPADNPDHPAPPIYEAIATRSERNREVIAALRDAERAGQLTDSVDRLISSVIHVNMNRVFTNSPRAQEMVLYDLLRRHYDGILARQRTGAGGGEKLKKDKPPPTDGSETPTP
ncbi:MAG: lantibiotic dehydratase [Myxococcales bacterium]|nr:lantibiotic dehydratase [Myxococcales bacterium]